MSTSHKPADPKLEKTVSRPDCSQSTEDVERDPRWGESDLDPVVVDAAKQVFLRRRELLRRLA